MIGTMVTFRGRRCPVIGEQGTILIILDGDTRRTILKEKITMDDHFRYGCRVADGAVWTCSNRHNEIKELSA